MQLGRIHLKLSVDLLPTPVGRLKYYLWLSVWSRLVEVLPTPVGWKMVCWYITYGCRLEVGRLIYYLRLFVGSRSVDHFEFGNFTYGCRLEVGRLTYSWTGYISWGLCCTGSSQHGRRTPTEFKKKNLKYFF